MIATCARGLVAGVLSLCVLVVAFVPLERAFPARRQPILRPELAIDACFFFGQYVVWNAVSFAVLSSGEAFVSRHGIRWLAAQPIALQAVVAIVLGDVCVYWIHRAFHAWRPLWRFHSVHHTAEHLDFLAAHREHPVDGIATAFAQNLPAFAMGFPVDVIAAFVAFRGLWAIFIHSNVKLPIGPLRFVLGAPELHHWHHAKGASAANFANLAPWLDVLFRTYHRPDRREEGSYALGVDEAMPRGYLAQLLHPFATLFDRDRPAPPLPRCYARSDGLERR
jgi:sterol desaturase/sphingolipid hydroxylase (fatty acid hydroxylase superfamily)